MNSKTFRVCPFDFRKTFSSLSLAIIAIVAVSFTVKCEEKRPNIIVFLVDDMGVMDCSLPGADQHFYETPNLEKLAAAGMTFENGYCAHPRCVPSRFGIQTGRSPYRNGAQIAKVAEAMAPYPTIGEALKKAGYATSFFGKWHLGKTEAEFPHNRGYDYNIAGCSAGAPSSYFFPYHVDYKTGKPGKYGPMFNLTEGEEGEHITDRLTVETNKWIRQQQKSDPDKPFLVFLSHYAVHTPIQGKPDEVEYFAKKIPDLPPLTEPDGFIKADGSSKERRDNPDYASMVKTMDDSLGSVMSLLDELEIIEDTVILFTSDHGGLSNRSLDSKRGIATSNLPYRAGKGHLYEGGLRVPFVVSYPAKVSAGSKNDDMVIGTDILPTLLDLAGQDLEPDNHIDGISLVPALEGGQLDRESFFWHHPLPRPIQTGDKAVSVSREGKFKLVKSYFPEVGYELYDLKNDPYEKNNLADEKPSRVKKMVETMIKHLVEAEASSLRADWKNKEIVKPVTAEH